MTKKQSFIQMVEELINFYKSNNEDVSNYEDALIYFKAFQEKQEQKNEMTDKGKSILLYMQENKNKNQNLFKSADIAEGLFISSRSVSGSIRKLVNDGYVERIGESPIIYTLTSKGDNL